MGGSLKIMSSKRKHDSRDLEKLMHSLKFKITKVTKSRNEFVDCMARFSSVFMSNCEELTEISKLLIEIIEQIESQKGTLNNQQIDFLKRCLEE